MDGVTSTAAELNILDGVTSTTAELNILDGATVVVGEINALDLGSTAVGTAIASKAVILDANKDYTGVRNFTITGELDAATLDISGDADIDGTLEADAITIGGVTLAETIADTVGAMVSSNTETNITVSYEDADNTLDFVIGTLNQDTTGTADNFTVSANNSTDETVYPVFVDGATGSQGAETDTGLTYNPSTGLLTSTGFSGNLTGTLQTAAQTNITSVGTLTALTGGTGDFNWDSNTLVVDSSANRVGILNAAPDVSLDVGSATDAVHMPTGTTAQRPGSPAAGYFRYNTTLGKFEGYTDDWGSIGGGAGTNMDTNIYTGDGSTTAFTLSTAPDDEQNLMVFVDGVFQAHNAYSVSGTTLTLSAAPASGRVITAFHSTTTVGGSNNTINTMTGDNSDTTLTLSVAPVHENNTQVYFDGVYQSKSNYAISGTTLTFSTAPPTGVLVEAITNTNTSSTTANQLLDADSDTKIQVEESSDEDKIRFDTGGTERMVLDSTSLTVTPKIVSDAGIDIDNFNIDGTTIALSSGDLTLDVAGDIILDADGGDITFNDDGTSIAVFQNNSTDFIIRSLVSDKDIIFQGNDGGSTITALTLDMSDAGSAYFNNTVGIGTTSPESLVAIKGSSGDADLFSISDVGVPTSGDEYGVGMIKSNAAEYMLNITSYNANGKGVRIYNNGGQNAFLVTQAGGDRFIVDASGNVGVGTASPSSYYADDLVVAAPDEGGITIASSNTAHRGILAFADATSGDGRYAGYVAYDHYSDAMTLNGGGAGTTMMQIDSAGLVTKPLQSAFLATVGSEHVNIGNGDTITFDNQIYDRNSDYNNTGSAATINGASTGAYTFNAPVSGIYQISAVVRTNDLDSASTYWMMRINTSNREYDTIFDTRALDANPLYWSFNCSISAELDAGDIARCQMFFSGGTQQVDIETDSRFSIILLA